MGARSVEAELADDDDFIRTLSDDGEDKDLLLGEGASEEGPEPVSHPNNGKKRKRGSGNLTANARNKSDVLAGIITG